MGKANDKLQQKSPAEFFAENKNIAGFDNPGKCLYTTVRELVENALDAAESIRVLPDINVTIEEISREDMNSMRGVGMHERIDEELFAVHETAAAKKKRIAKETKEAAQKESAQKDTNIKQPKKKSTTKKDQFYYRVCVKDNGVGMPHNSIPDMLGRVLSGTKYGVCQTRGKFGLGAKMALIWSKMTTGLPFDITSATVGSSQKSHYKLDIDIHKNQPVVHVSEQFPNSTGWHGSELSLVIEGNWSYYRSYIIRYLRQIAVITPYTNFSFKYNSIVGSNCLELRFTRRTDVIPPPPTATNHHPSSVDLELIKRLASNAKQKNVKQFLIQNFDSINAALAVRLIDELRMNVTADMNPQQLTPKQLARLHELFHQVSFSPPSGDHLSPSGEYNLRLGVMKELKPDMVATYQGDVRTFEGHSMMVECAVSIGGKDVKPGINVFRFANRIPLLFEAGNDVCTRTACKRIAWSAYKINQNADKIGVFVSIVSTKIPFKGAGKEYIGDDIPEMVAAVKQAMQACCLQLRGKIQKQIAAREQMQRKKNLTKYIPNVTSAIFKVLEDMTETPARGPKRRKLEEKHGILNKVKTEEFTIEQLEQKLTQHVEKIDSDMALEYQLSTGIAQGNVSSVFILPQLKSHQYTPNYITHNQTTAMKLLMSSIQSSSDHKIYVK